jgi:hypothetical protein
MEHEHRLRRWALRAAVTGAATLAAAAMLSSASPASAKVALLPVTAPQGDAANLTFRVTNDSPTSAVNRIEVQLPADQPIAEVYPLSTDNWAPSTTTRPVAKPVQPLHGLDPLTEAPASVIWQTMPGLELKPGASADLTIVAGPLPNAPQLVVTVLVTHVDGTVEKPSVVIPLTAGTGAASHAHDGGQPAAAPTTPAGTESGIPYGRWVLAILVLLAGLTIFSLIRQRKPSTPEETSKDKKADLVSAAR